MKQIVTLLLFSLLAACGSGSSGSSTSTESRVLDEHACLDGTWLAVSRNIKINNVDYPVATDRIFVVVSGQSNISHLTGISDFQTSYAGSGLRSWTTKNNMTEDVHAGRWAATFDNSNDLPIGSLVIQDACRTSYSGDVEEDALPQCTSNQLFERNTQITLDCSGDVGLMKMENSKASINYQRLSDNMALTSFTDESNPHPVEIDIQPPLPVELLEPEEIKDIVEEELADNSNDPEEELTNEEIDEIIDVIIEEIEEEIGEDPNPLTPDDSTNPTTPLPVDEIEPTEPPDPREIDSDEDGVNDAEDAFPFDASETKDFDNDSTGDNADTDDDNDGVSDVLDAFQFDPEETLDTDGDGIGNTADIDDDNDGVLDTVEARLGTNPLLFDTDFDLVSDGLDAFPNDPSEQLDSDGDGVGDNTDAFPFNPNHSVDSDNDNVADESDAFPEDPTEQYDSDGDGVGDNADAFPNNSAEDTDSDGDGVGDNADAFPNNSAEDTDSDGDGVGDNADAFPNNSAEDTDSDGDDVGDNADAFPNNSAEDTDSDGDGVGDNADAFPNNSAEDTDSDGDGVGDNADAFPNNSAEDTDSDGDGVGDNADAFPNNSAEDTDSDGDGVGDNADAFPNNYAEDTDSDGDGVGDNADAFPNNSAEDTDSDGDGVGDNADAFPNNSAEDTDSDGDGVGDNADAFPNNSAEDTDSDGDGVGDNADAFPNNSAEDTDSDGDGVGDNADAFPNDANEDTDSDGDGVGDNADAFPNNSAEDTDLDGDGVGDNSDAFPNDANEDTDSDGDGVGNNADAFPNDANENTDSDGDGVGDNSDLFPFNANENSDNDGDGTGDNSDLDDDNDGVADIDDPAPFDDSIPGEPDPLNPFTTQDFQSFYTGQSWYLTNFGLPDDALRSDYIDVDGNILFDIRWTKRTINHMADLLSIDRNLMTRELANAFCTPKIEVGKANVYGAGNSENMIAELDTDLNNCIIGASEPANVRLRSFIPTKVGYRYAVTAEYQMRNYNMPSNAYRHFVMRFGATAEHFDPSFGEYTQARIDIVATHKFSRLVLRDNGLPDSYGILVDNIEVTELGKVDHYDDCSALFSETSKGFRKCIAGEVDTDQSCSMDHMMVNKYLPGNNVPSDRQVTDNAFLIEESTQGSINFLSLGKKGKLKVSCYIDGYLATYPIFNKQLSFREISWGNATPDNYPEQARVWVQLSHCLDDRINGINHLGLVSTSESFNYEFTENDEGISYQDCRMKKLVVKDKTPDSSPSTDGFDINSINISEIQP